MKKLLVLFCVLAALAGVIPAAALEGEQSRAGDTLYTLGLIQGMDSGGYDLASPATRAQFAATVQRLVNLAG